MTPSWWATTPPCCAASPRIGANSGCCTATARKGRPHYQALIQATRRQLHPNRRALTTASNDIGVNAVFAQRVLNAALAPEARME